MRRTVTKVDLEPPRHRPNSMQWVKQVVQVLALWRGLAYTHYEYYHVVPLFEALQGTSPGARTAHEKTREGTRNGHRDREVVRRRKGVRIH